MFGKIAICTCNIPVNSYPSGLEIENGYIISKIYDQDDRQPSECEYKNLRIYPHLIWDICLLSENLLLCLILRFFPYSCLGRPLASRL